MTKTVICNACGKVIFSGQTDEIIKEDYVIVRKSWGYFSDKDGETHEFSLCEKCYDRITEGFVKKISITETSEIL